MTTPEALTPEEECNEVCTSSCHADDCEHHGHIAARQTPDGLREALDRIIESWEATIKVIDMPAPYYRTSVLDAMAVWPKGANGPIAISAYEALVERLRDHRAVVSTARAALAATAERPLDVERERAQRVEAAAADMLLMWRTRHSIDPGIVRQRPTIIRALREALETP